MPGFGDYILIFVLALVLFGPKKMPELARQLGKLMAEFRKASNEFKMQMEEELRASDRAEQEKKIAALAAAAPPATDAAPPAATTETAPAIATSGELAMRPPETGVPVAQSEATQKDTAPDAVNALADSVPAAHEGQETHG
jgi:sec-independent protein translocase protein TatB